MIKNLYEKLWLKMPIDYYGVCTIYPLTLREYLHYHDVQDGSSNELSFDTMFFPFTVSYELLEEKDIAYNGNLWDFYFMDHNLLAALSWTITILTREDKVRIDGTNHRICFSDERYLDASNCDEFIDIVRQTHGLSKYHSKQKNVPHFKNKKDEERYKKYMANRERNQKTKEGVSLTPCIQFIQMHSPSYISDEEILTWSYWKLIHWYEKLILKTEYADVHACFAQHGGKDLLRSINSLKQDIMTKV